MALQTRIKRRIISSAPGRHVIDTSKSLYIPGFYGLSLYQVVPAYVRQIRASNIIERASGISFNIVMAIPPTLIFAFTLIPLFPISDQFVLELFALIRDVIPGERNNSVIIGFLVDFLKRPRTGLLSFGLLLAIYFSSNALMGILRAFDKEYPGFVKRRGLQRRKVAVQLTLLVLVLVFICLLVLIAQGRVLDWLGVEKEFWKTFIDKSRWIVIFLVLFYIVSFIYQKGPARVRQWPLLTPGAVLATGFMILATALVSLWVNNFGTYNKLYGSIGAIFVLMSLVYVNSLVILMGFELNVTLTNLNTPAEEPVNP